MFAGPLLLLVSSFQLTQAPQVYAAEATYPIGEIQVITSDATTQPLTFAPIENTACKSIGPVFGNYEYHRCHLDPASGASTCAFVSFLEILHIPGHDETLHFVEKSFPGTLPGTGAPSAPLTPFHYVQLWAQAGAVCKMIYADDQMQPTWQGAALYPSDVNTNTLLLVYPDETLGLLKKIQDFPIVVHPVVNPVVMPPRPT